MFSYIWPASTGLGALGRWGHSGRRCRGAVWSAVQPRRLRGAVSAGCCQSSGLSGFGQLVHVATPPGAVRAGARPSRGHKWPSPTTTRRAPRSMARHRGRFRAGRTAAGGSVPRSAAAASWSTTAPAACAAGGRHRRWLRPGCGRTAGCPRVCGLGSTEGGSPGSGYLDGLDHGPQAKNGAS